MSTRVAAMISLAVHAAIGGAIVWTTAAGRSRPAQDPGFYGTAPEGGGLHGLGAGRAPPPTGPSIPPDRAAEYAGRYRISAPNQAETTLLVTVVNDGGIGEEHWSLMLQEGSAVPYKLVLAATDSFFVQLDPRRRVVFLRAASAVTSVELTGVGRTRRGDKVRAAERD